MGEYSIVHIYLAIYSCWIPFSFVETTPSLSHIFIACQDGSVDTFDVDRGVVAPYRIKNLWIEQDELLRRSGVPNAPSKKRIPA